MVISLIIKEYMSKSVIGRSHEISGFQYNYQRWELIFKEKSLIEISTLAWAFKGAACGLTCILPSKYRVLDTQLVQKCDMLWFILLSDTEHFIVVTGLHIRLEV